VPEAIGVLAPRARGQQVLAREAEQARVDDRLVGLDEQFAQRRAHEVLPSHRCALEHGTLVLRQAVESRRDERVDRRRDALQRTALREHRRHLLEVERIALRRLGDVLARGRVERPLQRDLVQQLAGLLVGERLERHAAAGLRQPARPRVEQVRPCEAEQQHRRVVRPAGEVLQQVEQRRLRPVDVFDEHDERTLPRELLEQPAHRPEGLTSGRRVRADRTEHARRDELCVVGVAEALAHALLAPEHADHLHERPEGDAFPVCEAAAGQDLGLVAERGAELRR
jgi:hypothetical protein